MRGSGVRSSVINTARPATVGEDPRQPGGHAGSARAVSTRGALATARAVGVSRGACAKRAPGLRCRCTATGPAGTVSPPAPRGWIPRGAPGGGRVSDRAATPARRDGGVGAPPVGVGRHAGAALQRGAPLGPGHPQGWGRRWSLVAATAALAVVPAAATGPFPAHPSTAQLMRVGAPLAHGAGVDAAAAESLGDLSGLVDIYSRLPGDEGAAGTGILVSPDGQLVTNAHVVASAEQIVVAEVPGGRTYRAELRGTDTVHDVAVLRLVGASDMAVAPLGDSDDLHVGDPVEAVGNVGGAGGAPTVSTGKVTALGQQVLTTGADDRPAHHLAGMIEVSARVQAGDSGGPLLSAAGLVVGMDTAADQRSGFAIPINAVIADARHLGAAIGSPSPEGNQPDPDAPSPPSTAGLLALQLGPQSETGHRGARDGRSTEHRGGAGADAGGLARIGLGATPR